LCLLHPQDGLLQLFKPEPRHCGCCFGHQAATLPLLRDPESAIVVAIAYERYRADDLPAGVIFEPQRPVPLFTALDGWQGVITIEDVCAIFGKRPGYS
jgi:hypothetical protein